MCGASANFDLFSLCSSREHLQIHFSELPPSLAVEPAVKTSTEEICRLFFEEYVPIG